MKDIGLIFKAEMVRAMLDRLKNQTRRLRGLIAMAKEKDEN